MPYSEELQAIREDLAAVDKDLAVLRTEVKSHQDRAEERHKEILEKLAARTWGVKEITALVTAITGAAAGVWGIMHGTSPTVPPAEAHETEHPAPPPVEP